MKTRGLPNKPCGGCGAPDVAAGADEDRPVPVGPERRKLAGIHYKGLLYQFLGHPTKPAIKGGNVGIWREDFEQLNGFDENFQGWGCEDDDLGKRLRQSGVRALSLMMRKRRALPRVSHAISLR